MSKLSRTAKKRLGSNLPASGDFSITAYFPNLVTGETLPGLSVANDVSHLHVEINAVKHLDSERRAGQK